MVLFEEGDLWHFPFEVGPVLEEVALVVLVELVPHLPTCICVFLILLLGYCDFVLAQGFLRLLLHFGGEAVEDYLLFGAAPLVEFCLSPLLLVPLHC